jgi:hypothetical protein
MVSSASQDSVKFGNNKNSKFVSVITRVMKILEKFANNYEKRLNFTKLARLLNLNPSEVDEIIKLILSFQELFTKTFTTYVVKKKIVDNQIFLITEPKKSSQFIIPKKIKLSSDNFNLLSDIIYMFKFVKRGKGFNVAVNGTELLSNIKELWNYHPYFFEVNENGLMYPSEFGLNLGELILSYKKSGRVIELIPLDNHIILVEKNKRK